MSATLTFQWQGNTFRASADRALFWAEQSALLLSDVHLGKGELFQRRGLPIPEAHSGNDLKRLNRLVEQSKPKRIIILGDLVHADPHATDQWPKRLLDWRARHPQIDVTLLLGNHDRNVIPVMQSVGVDTAMEMAIGGLNLRHEPVDDVAESDLPVVCGHLHPVMRFTDRYDTFRLPVFWIQEQQLVLPAFGQFTGGYRIEPRRNDRVLACAPGVVSDISTVPKKK